MQTQIACGQIISFLGNCPTEKKKTKPKRTHYVYQQHKFARLQMPHNWEWLIKSYAANTKYNYEHLVTTYKNDCKILLNDRSKPQNEM